MTDIDTKQYNACTTTFTLTHTHTSLCHTEDSAHIRTRRTRTASPLRQAAGAWQRAAEIGVQVGLELLCCACCILQERVRAMQVPTYVRAGTYVHAPVPMHLQGPDVCEL